MLEFDDDHSDDDDDDDEAGDLASCCGDRGHSRKVALPGASLRTLHALANASGITARPRAAEGRLPMRPV